MDPAAIRLIARGARVVLDERLLVQVAAQRQAALTVLTDCMQPVYGVNTGMGRLSSTALTADEQAEHQARLLIGRAVGGPPWLSAEEVRALFAVRLRGFLTPETGASADAVRFLVDRLNDGFVPAVPATGLGSAGEILALSHAFQTFLGIGTVLEDGRQIPASQALADRGVEPYRPGPKEGLSFIQGAPITAAQAVLLAAQGFDAVDRQLLCVTTAVDVLGAPRGIYRPELAGSDSVLADVLACVRDAADGGVLRDGVVQAPVSLRVGPQAIAHARRTLVELEDAARRFLSAPTDSPAFVDGEFVSTAGFHAAELGLRMDAAKAALVHVAEVGVQRMHRMLDERFSGLTPQLTPRPGPNAGLAPLHKRAVGELHAMRMHVAPASLGALDTSAGQEDVQVFAAEAAYQLYTAVVHLDVITACELITAHQAHTLRAKEPAPALAEVYRQLSEVVPAVVEDRPLGPEVTRLVDALRTGKLRAVTTFAAAAWSPRAARAARQSE
ncbi:histidine ammonia-lyase [Amycolatopsis acidicola]|uniref:Histidine ammonia-lyase n=1 Tax=Amycolatopsis acidicola TaxID=2596893 RepID=A0A5N0VJV4_9PSEU|nr:histidine ammonia-lyase [Amycolatopsis acidicola]